MGSGEPCVLPGSLREPQQGATLLRAADPSARVEVTIVLRPMQPIDDAALERNALKPASERQFASSTDLAAAPAAIAAVAAFAASCNLEVVQTDPVQRRVDLAGTVADMERAFGTKLNIYGLPSGEQYRGREGTLTLPCSVAPFVTAVLGLTTLRTAHRHDSA
jgi:kumamolisin